MVKTCSWGDLTGSAHCRIRRAHKLKIVPARQINKGACSWQHLPLASTEDKQKMASLEALASVAADSEHAEPGDAGVAADADEQPKKRAKKATPLEMAVHARSTPWVRIAMSMAVARPARRASASTSCAMRNRLGSEVFGFRQRHEKRFFFGAMSSSPLGLETSVARNLSSIDTDPAFVGYSGISGAAALCRCFLMPSFIDDHAPGVRLAGGLPATPVRTMLAVASSRARACATQRPVNGFGARRPDERRWATCCVCCTDLDDETTPPPTASKLEQPLLLDDSFGSPEPSTANTDKFSAHRELHTE